MISQSVRVQAKGQVTIPQEFREMLNIKKGDLVVFERTDQGILLKPVIVYADADLRQALSEQVTSLRERFVDLTEDEIESLVADAVRWARDKHD